MLSACYLSPSVPLLSTPPTPSQYQCKPRRVHTEQGPIPLSQQGHRNNYKKDQYWDEMSSGEQTCQHPPRECPCPLGALTQLTGDVGCHPPPPGCPPTCLTYSHHLLRFAGQGLRTAHFLYRHSYGICFTWLPVACLLFSSVCDCRESVFWGTRGTKQGRICQFIEKLETAVDSWAVCSEATVFVEKQQWLNLEFCYI